MQIEWRTIGKCVVVVIIAVEHFKSATKIALLNLIRVLLQKLACLSLSGLTRQSILYLFATQQVANADEIKFLGN